MDSASIDLLKQFAGAIVIGGLQGYNMWAHRKNTIENQRTKALVSLTYEDLREDLDRIRDSVESLTVKLNGGDRRKTRTIAFDSTAPTPEARRWRDESLKTEAPK